MKPIAPFAVAGRRQGHPGGDHVGPIEAPIGRVLVPGDERRVARLLDEEVRGPAEEVRPVEILDRVEDALMTHEIGDPGEEEMRFVPQLALSGPPLVRSNASRRSRHIRRRGLAHHAQRKTKPSRRNFSICVALSTFGMIAIIVQRDRSRG